MFGLSRIQLIMIGAVLAVALVGGAVAYVYRKGEASGSSAVTTAVQTRTIQTIDAARISKEKTDAEVHSTPYDDRADGLR